MTIKEQLELGIIHPSDCELDTAIHNCEFIVEDIAIQFAEWLERHAFGHGRHTWVLHKDNKIGIHEPVPPKYTTKQLFELFKKENNL